MGRKRSKGAGLRDDAGGGGGRGDEKSVGAVSGGEDSAKAADGRDVALLGEGGGKTPVAVLAATGGGSLAGLAGLAACVTIHALHIFRYVSTAKQNGLADWFCFAAY